MSYNKEDVKEKLTIEDICTLLEYFGAEPVIYGSYIVSKTICHGGDSNKLYYYENTQLFKCYTGECGTFDIFELVLKVQNISELNTAISFVVNFFNLQGQIEDIDDLEINEDWKYFNRHNDLENYEVFSQNKLSLPVYESSTFLHLPQPKILNWEKEGIRKEVCDFMGVRYDGEHGCIVIPHYNEDGDIIGIRQRTLVQEYEKYGKYRPWRNKKTTFNHPLAFNLYGLNVAKKNIEQTQTAVIVESEKAVMQYISYFGTANDICVAVCGHSISKYQFNLLRDMGVKELIVAFDKDFEEIGNQDYFNVINGLQKLHDKYGSYLNISFVFDKDGTRLGYKDSPLDCGRDIFLKLLRERVYL